MKNQPPAREKRGQESRVISVRLHPDDQHEGEALNVFDDLRAQGYTPRQIMTHALLHVSGHTPEMFRHESLPDGALNTINVRLGHIADMIEGNMAQLLHNVKQADPDAFRQFANNEQQGEYDLGDDFIRNAQKAARKTFKQRQGG
jgi:hypothetical protein